MPIFNFDRPECAVVFGQHHHRARAGLNYRFGRNQQRFFGAHVHELHRHEHAGHQPACRIGEFDARLQRSRRRVHIRHDGLHRAVERRARHRRAARLHLRTGTQQRGLAFGHFGLRPYRRQPADTGNRGAGHHRHSFSHHQLGQHAADRRGQRDARLRASGTFDETDLLLVHTGLTACADAHHRRARPARCLACAAPTEILPAQRSIRGRRDRPAAGPSNAIECRAHVQPLDKAGRARLHDRLITLVVGDASDRRHLRRQRAFGDKRRAHAEVLLRCAH